MKTALGYLILLITLLVVLLRNPRWAVYGMVVCDNVRPGDEHIGFGMETVRFSISYYAVALGFLLIFYRRYRITSDRFHWTILFMFLSVVNSALHAPCWGPALTQIDNYFKMLLQYYLICAFIRDEKQMRELFWAIGLSMFVVSLAFFYNKFYLGLGNWEGATGDRNEMAMAGVMAVPFLFMLGLTSKMRLTKIIAWGTLPFIALMILFSLSRGGMLGLGAVGGYLLYRLHHKRWLVVVGVFSAVVGLLNMPSEVVARFMTIGSASKKDASAIGRLNAWAAARNMAKDRPLWGMGTGNFLVRFRTYAPVPNDIHVAHSSFYQLLGEQGLPGVGIWIYLVFMLWLVTSWCEIRVQRLERGQWTDTRYYLVMLKASWIGYALCGAFLSQEDMDFFYHLLAISSRYTVFIGEREAAVRAERAARLAAEKEFNRKQLVLPPAGVSGASVRPPAMY
ncbi:MAG: O-antigen ligase family protein [Myxococcales bacterium]|nr:O-antigen ligase family protein [Myxococcales bacterium]